MSSCYFCRKGIQPDYKNVKELEKFISQDGRIKSARQTHLCANHQRKVSTAIKNARILALL